MYLDFLKVLRFSFPVVVVGFYPIMNGFTDGPSIKPNHTTLNVTWTVLIQIQLNWVFFVSSISISFYCLYSNTKL